MQHLCAWQEYLQRILLHLTEAGIIHKIISKYQGLPTKKVIVGLEQSMTGAFRMVDVAGAVMALSGGLILATIIIFVERHDKTGDQLNPTILRQNHPHHHELVLLTLSFGRKFILQHHKSEKK